MILPVDSIQLLRTIIGFALVACAVSFAWAPLLTELLYKFNITRQPEFDDTLGIGDRESKKGTPIMGGLLIIITVAVITYFFNWTQRFTWMPIGVMLLAGSLGAADDLFHVFKEKRRRTRKLGHVIKLIKVHKHWYKRVWYAITLPWTMFKRSSLWLGSHPGKGLHVHERLIMQFLTGSITAWWVYFKLGQHWQQIYIPFDGFIDIGWLIIPLIIFFVMATANAVNFADGMDGLAGGALIITFSGLALLSWMEGYEEIAILNSTAVGALLTYTYFNIKPARFQMGDVGSLGLGALLAINTIVIQKMLLLPLLGFIFYIELISVVLQVASRHLGQRIFKMAPLHHHFEMIGWSEGKTVMRFWVAHGIVVLTAIWIALY